MIIHPGVMPGLVPGIHVLSRPLVKDVDGRDKPGHDDGNSLPFDHSPSAACARARVSSGVPDASTRVQPSVPRS